MNEPLRITLVGPLPPPSGGMANQTLQLQALLRQEGFDVDVIQVNAPYRPSWVGRMRGLRAAFRLVAYVARLWSAAGRSRLFHVMANSGWSWHLFAAPAIWIGHLRGVPVVVNYRGGEAETFFGRSIRWVRPSLTRASAVVVPSGYLRDIFHRWGIEARIVPNIIDTEIFMGGCRAQDEGARTGPRILVARNLEPIYDIATAIRAFREIRARLPGTVMTIAGSGPQAAELQAEAARLGVGESIEFTGRLDNAGMAMLFGRADVLLNTSLVDNMPISLLEAMSCGVPIVSTNVGGIPHLVEDGESALLVAPGDHQAMADAVVRVLRDADLRRRITSRAQADAQSYTWPRVRDELMRIYRSLTGSG